MLCGWTVSSDGSSETDTGDDCSFRNTTGASFRFFALKSQIQIVFL